jgi:endonuclease-8
MPEVPEVMYQASYIASHFTNHTLKSVDIVRGRYKTHGAPTHFKAFHDALPLRLLDVETKGKVMVFQFTKGWYIISRLGLMGTWHLPGDEPKWIKTVPNIHFTFNGKVLYYTDPVSYGTLTITQNREDVDTVFESMAPDITTVTFRELQKRLVEKPKLLDKQMEDVLLDALFSGIGNYLKSEILYEARISPLRKVSKVTDQEWKTFLAAAKRIIKRRIKIISSGDVTEYMETMRVYRKKLDPEGNKVHTHVSKTGRTTYWVPKLQN